MAYINKREYEKLIEYAPSGVDKSSITKALVSRGHKIQGINDQEQKTFGGQLLKDIASPFIKGVNILETAAPVVGAVARALPASIGLGSKEKARERITSATEKAQERQKQQINTIFGAYNPATSLKEGIGTGLELVSTVYGGGNTKSVAQAGIRGALKSATKTGIKAGAVGGAGFGLGRGLSEDETVKESLSQGALGGALGALGGGGFRWAATFGGSL